MKGSTDRPKAAGRWYGSVPHLKRFVAVQEIRVADLFRQEDVLKHSTEAFTETINLKIRQLRRYVPKGKNPALTGQYVEEMVRAFVRNWLRHRQLVTGTFYSESESKADLPPLQIDGIVYDPHLGPTILRENDFAVVHPAFCTSVIEIKMSHAPGVANLQERLKQIHKRYFSHATCTQVMGIIVASKVSSPTASINTVDGSAMPSYTYNNGGWCPIFVLFKEVDDEYYPDLDAISAMVHAIYRNQYVCGNFH